MKDRLIAEEVDLLLVELDEAFDRKSWHGPNLRGSLRGLDAVAASWRPAPGRHNVWEVALHVAYWKYAVRRRLTGQKRGSFGLPGSNWFERPAPGADADKAWREDLEFLVSLHDELREVVASLAGQRLRDKERVVHLVHGAAAHDLYHAGQIQLLKRLRRG